MIEELPFQHVQCVATGNFDEEGLPQQWIKSLPHTLRVNVVKKQLFDFLEVRFFSYLRGLSRYRRDRRKQKAGPDQESE